VQEYKSKTMLAVEALREKIEAGEVGPGDRFDVRRLAKELSMSITPVREALRVLQADGLVVYDEHRSISPLELTVDEAGELYLLRSTLESLATKLAASRMTSQDGERIVECHSVMIEAVESGDHRGATRANREWHTAIYRAAHARFFESYIQRLWNQVAWAAIWQAPGRLEQSVQEHGKITELLIGESLDKSEAAAELMRLHIVGSEQLVLDQIKQPGS
jgi:DNA-binding GntR family transcriptional regulator